jgi:NAD(P)-dependent dehydrogenase (short-subunit alcohol dehydrogenase family)
MSSGATAWASILPDCNSAKAAMLAFSKTMSFELAPDKILVNGLC